mmetsp:Transcript_57758/g.64603  ORF Transcript_57758/g.64603 Transcript_57758/m.64603 type:complete len:486 (-) Transcript_57758:533-1990(-)
MPGFSFSSVKAKNTMIVSIAIATIIFSVIISISVVEAFTNHLPSSPLTPSGSKITGGAADHAVPTSSLLIPLFAESENSRRSGNGGNGNGQRRRRKRPSSGSTSRDRGRGGARGGGGNANDYDYSGGNLKYGSGKYTQREHQGGVNLSSNGRSLQDQVYREDRQNVDRARGRPRGESGEGGNDFMGNDFGSRMDEIEEMERDLGMRGQGRRGGGQRGGQLGRPRDGGRFEDDFDEYEEEGPRRMGGGGLLRDMRGGMGGRDGRRDGRDEYGGMDMGGREEYGGQRNGRGGDYGGAGGGGMMSNNNGRGANIMGGSSKGRGGGYAGDNQQSMNELSNERRRYEEATGGYSYMDRDEQRDERDDFIDVNNGHERGSGIGTRSSTGGGGGGGRGGGSNFDRLMGRGSSRGGGREDYDDDYEMMRGGRERGGGDRRMNNGGRSGGRNGDYYEDDYDQRSDRGYNDQYGSGGSGSGRRGGGGGLLRDMMP